MGAFTVVDEPMLRAVERRMIGMMYGVRPVDRVSTDVLCDRVSVVVLYCCKTWALTVADEAWLRGVEHRMIRMCGVRLVDRVSTDVLRDRVGVVVKTEDMIIQSRLRRYGHVMRGDINSQISEVMEVEITWKRKKGQPRKSWEECVKKDLDQYGLKREDAYDRKKWREQIRAKIANPGQRG